MPARACRPIGCGQRVGALARGPSPPRRAPSAPTLPRCPRMTSKAVDVLCPTQHVLYSDRGSSAHIPLVRRRRAIILLGRLRRGSNDDAAVRLLTDAFAPDTADGCDDVVNVLPLECGHRLQLLVLTALRDPLRHTSPQRYELLAPL